MSKKNPSHHSSLATTVITMALLVALEIILTRFLSINTPILRIGFGFLPVAIAGILYGPLWAGAGYAAGDLLGMAIFPTGAYFPGFTLSAFLTGIVFGLFLHDRTNLRRTVIAAVIVVVLIDFCLDTFWLSILMGQGFFALLPTRIIKVAVMLPLEIVLIQLFAKKVLPRVPAFRALPQLGH